MPAGSRGIHDGPLPSIWDFTQNRLQVESAVPRGCPSALVDMSRRPHTNPHATPAVQCNGTIRWKGKEIFITEVLRRQPIGLIPNTSSAFNVYFGSLHLGTIGGDQAKFIPRSTCLIQAAPTFLLLHCS